MTFSPQQPPEPTNQPDLSVLLNDPEFRASLAYGVKKLVDLADTAAKSRANRDRRATWVALALSVFVLLIVVLPVSLLVYLGKMPAEAATFVLGAIVGAAFTFLGNFFPDSS